jgi:hypothetical protein
MAPFAELVSRPRERVGGGHFFDDLPSSDLEEPTWMCISCEVPALSVHTLCNIRPLETNPKNKSLTSSNKVCDKKPFDNSVRSVFILPSNNNPSYPCFKKAKKAGFFNFDRVDEVLHRLANFPVYKRRRSFVSPYKNYVYFL